MLTRQREGEALAKKQRRWPSYDGFRTPRLQVANRATEKCNEFAAFHSDTDGAPRLRAIFDDVFELNGQTIEI